MQKKLIIIALASLLFVLTLLLIIFSTVRQGSNIKPQPSDQPTAVPISQAPALGLLKVVSTSPVDGADNVDLNSGIEIVFNRSFNSNEVIIEFMDAAIKNVKHSQKIQGTTLILESTNVLTQSTVYTIRIRDQKLRVLKEFSFLTLTVQPSPDTRPEAALTKTIERTLRERPDVYLANLLPYQSFDFSMVLEIDDQGYFQFKVSSSRLSGAILKDRVAQWLLGLELSQKQISGLNIIYP
ncbi:hypothetical protein A2313_02795 [Candidatus Roizmanbacteria bacterium RIFOXYB2_FULL_41_10]|uniref:SbsA Ig-like domain-containing protein n=1 Tax=Candidatus Roizmanbacteria bacterium RIFOXYA1_FULL_41_12 TaxID=1802082 RepID=A0A1F7KAV1_9BACT|nr:MAG: hypothetical protein A2209_04830 [Candidatus Roizmanbacteria bacterium RIFOXYA1_FULL_41_12]OGK66753.1 MAG: hypothetical protein A2377_02490 [Candidatus Roizmanbacteria bacterium RIFOXYB1_FULL_41_27]OGK70664.1 MAG: hypothetical protein A2313_02795 [Candidatus Roizmanbacteria bacterium RIFOXYB2_FULL_41_10]OGK70873.1 MAG: hypothetical protein A2403_02215 [Candidatus Roizmanbacteria bacterium RIFOXYC1_FULL_41_16]OGK75546.1 MAG: hypothetical protein A2575_02480 [Candidatus Roizmanbacteria ba